MIKSEWAAPATCAPPPEHAHHEWHWLRKHGNKPEPVSWECGLWEIRGYDVLTPADAHELGWRYVAPCILPQEGER
jgi:hypothetical protein